LAGRNVRHPSAQDGQHPSALAIIAAQDAAAPVVPVELTTEALDFLKVAIPALTQYQDSHGQCPTPEVPAEIAETELWPYFLKQQDQILKDKWIESSNAGYDIGMERAIRAWLQKNQILWAPKGVEDSETAPPKVTPQ
jgi:hypothetical protein